MPHLCCGWDVLGMIPHTGVHSPAARFDTSVIADVSAESIESALHVERLVCAIAR